VNFAVSRPRWWLSRVQHVLFLVATTFCMLGTSTGARAQTDPYQTPATATPFQFPASQQPQPVGPNPDVLTPSSSQDQNNNTSPTSQANDSLTQSSRRQQTAAQNAEALARNRPRVPDRPTEFQRLVQASVGRNLPIFGASLFDNVPSTFAPVDNVPVTANYVVGPGDEVRIQLFGQVNRSGNYTVDRTGDIAFPQVGTIHVAGVRYSDLQSFLTSQFSRVYRNFQLNVNLGQLRSMQVFVVGAARSPGAYTISSLSTLLNALFASGGPLPQGSLRDIQVQRAGRIVTHFDLYDLLLRGDKASDVVLQPEDVIYIPPVGAQVAVYGSVDNPAIYEVHPGQKLSQVIELAGGKTSLALGDNVQVTRIYQHSERNVIEVDLKKTDPALANGDIVVVRAILDRYKNAVTLRGNVSFPGRYAWHEGMRIKDLVPAADQLISTDYYRGHNALGNPPRDPAEVTRNETRYRQAGQLNPANGENPSYPANGNTPYGNYPQNGLSGQNTPPVPYAQMGQTVPVDPNNPQYTQQIPGAALGASQQMQQLPPGTRSSTSSQGGGSVGAALTQSNGTFRPKMEVVLSAPDLDWSYAVIERLNESTLKTSLLAFNPQLLYQKNDPLQNLALQPGDVVTFFSTADISVPTSQQTRFIHLEGEFAAAGVYSVGPGETLRHLLMRVGGFTPDAYLYGSQFTRESTRRVQQQRLSEYADTLEERVSAFSAASSSRAISDRDAAASAAAAAEARQSIARLRQTIPVGRIVLELKPDSRSIDTLPDIPLEDGDRFLVPQVPSTVEVEGRVYSANAFVFQRDRKERDYLRKAGGPDPDADRQGAFILRADGSVFSKQYGNVSKARIFPGDTIVVPPQIDRRNLLRGLLDISSIFGQFGLAAAAVNVLR